MKLIVSCSSGTEACVKRELLKLGVENPKAFDGKFEIEGDYELLAKLTNISVSFQSDLNSDMVHLMECYVDSYQKLQTDPAAKILLGGK